MTQDTRGYILTFRCLNCGRHEASANIFSDVVLSDDDVKTRLLTVICKSCGWTGEVCGVSAVRIERAKSKSTRPGNGR